MVSNYFKFLIISLTFLYFGSTGLIAASSGDIDTENPASDISSSYKNTDVNDFYLSPNLSFGISKLSKPSMKGTGILFNLSMDHLSNGNLGGLLTENAFSFISFEYSIGKMWFSRNDVDLNVFVPVQVLVKKSYGVQSSRSGILSMVHVGLGGLLSTDVEGKGTDPTPEEGYKKEDNLEDWAVGLVGSIAYEMSFPVISYTGLVNVGAKWNISVLNISGSLNIKDGNEKFSTPGHLLYNYLALYVGMRFAL